MAEEAQQKVQASMTGMVEEIDKSYLRKLQSEMHQCAAQCCDDTECSIEKVHACIERCSQPLQHSQQYVQSQMNDIQDRLQRCVMQCQDKVKDKILPSTTEEQVREFKKEFESCAVACVDDSISTFPSHLKRIKAVLQQQKF